jgi:hypothetical protein
VNNDYRQHFLERGVFTFSKVAGLTLRRLALPGEPLHSLFVRCVLVAGTHFISSASERQGQERNSEIPKFGAIQSKAAMAKRAQMPANECTDFGRPNGCDWLGRLLPAGRLRYTVP